MTAGIYRHISPSGKSYVGQSRKIEDRHCGEWHKRGYKSCHAFRHAVLKYGQSNFKTEVLEEVSADISQEILNALEIKYIQLFKSTDKKYGYNICFGGYGGKPSPEGIQRIRESKLGKKRPDVSLRMKARKGFKYSAPSKLKGRTWKQKVNLSRRGLTPEQVIEATMMALEGYARVFIARSLGVSVETVEYNLSEESLKVSKTVRLGKKYQGSKGESNGSCKITQEIALEIRKATGLQKNIAIQFNVSKSLVSAIKRNKIWV